MAGTSNYLSKGTIRETKAAELLAVTKKDLKKIKKIGSEKEIKNLERHSRQNQAYLDSIIQVLKIELTVYSELPIAQNLKHNSWIDYLAMFPYFHHISKYDLALLKLHKYAISRKKYIKKYEAILDCEHLIEMYESGGNAHNQRTLSQLKEFKEYSEIAFGGEHRVFVEVERLKNKLIKE